MSQPQHRTRHIPRRRTGRRPLAVVVLLGALTVAAAGTPGSGAAFSAQTANPGNALAAATDWVAPVVAVTDPGAVLSGSVAIAATASDGGSGVGSVVLQRASADAGDPTWTTLCTATASPYRCTWDTTKVADGRYALRAIARDADGNTATSAVLSPRLVDNTAPGAALADPGTNLQPGPVVLTATATDGGSGVARVEIQRADSATGTFATICTQTTAPYSCTWTAPAGDHALRAVVTDAAGNRTTTTPIVRTVRDTAKPRGTAVSTTNAGTAGSVGTGDTLVLRWSEQMNLGSILTGLSTTKQTALTARFTNPSFGLGGGDDTLSFTTAGGGATGLGTIGLGSTSWLRLFAGNPTYEATAIARVVDGVTEVVITFGPRSGSTPAYGSAVRLEWTPSATARDLVDNAADATTVTQPTAAVAF